MAVDDDGCFTERITDFCHRYVKEADKDIIQAVKARTFPAFFFSYLNRITFMI